ncbi:MAG TPA: ABC transporter permease [Vicinamibacteria bacterium]|nr:ABC transporter permease [Vicinamibacteria bacterium]
MTSSRLLLQESFSQAFAVVREYRLRSALGALAMAAAVTALAGISTGLEVLEKFAAQATARSIGSDVFQVARVGQRGRLGRRELARKLERNVAISRADARFLDAYSGDLVTYAPSAQRIVDVTSVEGKIESAPVTGTTVAITRIQDMALAQGRFFSDDESRRGESVAVIGDEVSRLCFPSGRALGGTVRIAGRAFKVIGIQEAMGQLGGQSQDRYIWVPLGGFERAFGPAASLQMFAKSRVPGETVHAEDRARASLRAKRNLYPGQEDTFDVVTPDAARNFVAALSSSLGAAALPISLASLLAAFVVVTNTTLVSVAQRTREIGIRRAIGAKRANISAEVLAESLIVSVVGALAGLALVAALAAVASAILGLPLALAPATLARSLFMAAIAGLLSGALPALRAARADVLSSLRAD